MELKYTKTRETVEIDDNTIQVTSRSYTDKLSSMRVEISKDIQTSQQTLLKDLVTCLEKLTETDDCLTIVIRKKHGQPRLITQTWTETKEYYGK